MQDDVTLADGARISDTCRERRDRVVEDGQDDDVSFADPGRRFSSVADGQRQGCGYAFLVSPVEVDRIARPGQSQSQSDSRATGPDQPDRAGRLCGHLLRTVDGQVAVFAEARI